jgi:hypothetical protein
VNIIVKAKYNRGVCVPPFTRDCRKTEIIIGARQDSKASRTDMPALPRVLRHDVPASGSHITASSWVAREASALPSQHCPIYVTSVALAHTTGGHNPLHWQSRTCYAPDGVAVREHV